MQPYNHSAIYDIVIIGSGLGGLLCGYILSKEGYNVCIVEKNKKIGGCLQTFVRDGCVFDTGMHYIGSLEEGQILHRFFKYFDLTNRLKLKKLDEDGFDIINFKDKEYKYAQGYDNFINTLLQSFPDEKQGLVKYTDKLREISNSLNLYNLREVKSHNIIENEYIVDSTMGFIRTVTSDTKLQNVLAGLNALYAGKPDNTPLYIHAMINNFFIESAWRFIDGSFQIAKFLADSIINNGGTILKNREAKKFIPDTRDNELKFVELSNSERIESKYFISNVHPVRTLNMLEPDMMRKAYRNRIDSLENTISTFTVYIVLKKDTFRYLNYNYYYYATDNVWGVTSYSEKTWPEGYMLYTPATSRSDVYSDGIIVITYMKYDEMKKWENTTVGKRGDDYIEFKKNKAEKLLDLVERKFPGLRKKIKSYYTSTPLTYRDYTGTKEGSTYGVFRDCNDPLISYIPPRTKIPNLFLTGQNVNLHGVLGVTIGSLLTCSELLGLNYLIRKINDA
ncbi:MAG: NAD(P)-binding protein [Bacteroidota bacterium]